MSGCLVGVVVFATTLEECVRRVVGRTDHPTLKGKESEKVVHSMANSLQFPDQSEGFLFCRVIRSNDDFNRVFNEIVHGPPGHGQ